MQWSEPWLIGLLVFHVVCLCLTVLTCRFYRVQIVHFLLMGKWTMKATEIMIMSPNRDLLLYSYSVNLKFVSTLISHNIKTPDSWSKQHWSSRYKSSAEKPLDPGIHVKATWPKPSACCVTTKQLRNGQRNVTESLKCQRGLKFTRSKSDWGSMDSPSLYAKVLIESATNTVARLQRTTGTHLRGHVTVLRDKSQMWHPRIVIFQARSMDVQSDLHLGNFEATSTP